MKYTPVSNVLTRRRPRRLPEAPESAREDKKPPPVLISGCPGGKGDLLVMNSFSSQLRHFIGKVSLGRGIIQINYLCLGAQQRITITI